MCTQLHERLRVARERRGMSLATIARQWGVREQNLVLIEQDRFEELPTGLYGRTAVRAYATAVGFPADEVLAEVIDRLRTPEDPLDGLARVRGLARQPERTFKEMLHVPTPEVSLSSSTPRPRRQRHRWTGAARRSISCCSQLTAAGRRRAGDRGAASRRPVDAGALRPHRRALLRPAGRPRARDRRLEDRPHVGRSGDGRRRRPHAASTPRLTLLPSSGTLKVECPRAQQLPTAGGKSGSRPS